MPRWTGLEHRHVAVPVVALDPLECRFYGVDRALGEVDRVNFILRPRPPWHSMTALRRLKP